MNLAEASLLLAYIAYKDSRNADKNVVRSWHEHMEPYSLDDAKQAVREHFDTSTEYLMPAHVIQGIKRIRDERSAAANQIYEPLDGETADDFVLRYRQHQQLSGDVDVGARRVSQVLPPGSGAEPPEEMKRALAEGRARRRFLDVRCPWCDARPGKPCITPGTSGRTRGGRVHDARKKASSERKLDGGEAA